MEHCLGADWRNIRACRELAHTTRAELKEVLDRFDSEDTCVVVFGSLARDEFTPGSDLDWTLLVDGSADSKHAELAHEIENAARRVVPKGPGREGTFGSISFSHELIHQIGGEDDTNRNTTKRILLLLESEAVGRADAYERVLKGILKRYLTEDHGFSRGSAQHHVPRFLLNDFARYWRTMAVDFAYKQRSRFGTGAALRNIKLRMSRKLLYVSGLLTCFNCEPGFSHAGRETSCPDPAGSPECIECLRGLLRRTPLEILAGALGPFPHLGGTARKLFNSYDAFLGMLRDGPTRAHLDALKPDREADDGDYRKARELSHTFRDGLIELFFDDESRLSQLTKTYGVF